MATKIADFAAAQTAFHNRLDTAVAGVQQDIEGLNAKIVELQNTQGEITPEDQTLLDAIQARGEALAAKLEALDQITPPVAPTPTNPNPNPPEPTPGVPVSVPGQSAPNPNFGPGTAQQRAAAASRQ